MIERLAKSPLIAALVVLLAGLAGAGATLLWQGRAPALGEQAKVERAQVPRHLVRPPRKVDHATEDEPGLVRLRFLALRRRNVHSAQRLIEH